MSVRALLVDDAIYIRRLVSAIINDHDRGWEVVGEAADGQQAIDVAPETNPDLVLLDLSMPVMDGLQALPHLRKAVPSAVVVVLTGLPTESGFDAAEQSGAHAYLEKEAMVATLIPRLEAILAEVRNHTSRQQTTPS